ncbi:MAG TPA: hypothetical protein PK009_02115 [bacterium]|nr:hypothetical protein [bacterium]
MPKLPEQRQSLVEQTEETKPLKEENVKKGMSKTEILEHLKGIGTTNAKITYLNDILERGIIAEETKDNIIDIVLDLYIKKRDPGEAESFLIRHKKLKNVNIAKIYEDCGQFEGASIKYEKAGDEENRIRCRNLAAEKYEKEGLYMRAARLYGSKDAKLGIKVLKRQAIKEYQEGNEQEAYKILDIIRTDFYPNTGLDFYESSKQFDEDVKKLQAGTLV